MAHYTITALPIWYNTRSADIIFYFLTALLVPCGTTARIIVFAIHIAAVPRACDARPYGAALSVYTHYRFCCERHHTVGATIGRPPERNNNMHNVMIKRITVQGGHVPAVQ